MPELPEVETIVRGLRTDIMGKIITGVVLRSEALHNILQISSDRFYQGVVNQTVSTVLRKGKYIIVPLSNNNVIVFHLGMTGRMLIKKTPDIGFDEKFTGDAYVDKHTYMLLEFTDLSPLESDVEIHFHDIRTFGKIWLLENVYDIEVLDVPGLKNLGCDALGITLENFKLIMRGKRAIKGVLLDQSRIAGIGNIYADEACFYANINPARAANSLSSDEVAKLWLSIKSVLKQGIKYRGSSISDYTDTNGAKGLFQKHHRVYGRNHQACKECCSEIQKTQVSGRSTHFCPMCQK